MKTIVEKATALSKYMLDDGEVVVFTAQDIVVGNPPKFAIGDLNSNNAIMYENVTAPEDWLGNKYTFTGSEWAIDPNWVDPRLRDITP